MKKMATVVSKKKNVAGWEMSQVFIAILLSGIALMAIDFPITILEWHGWFIFGAFLFIGGLLGLQDDKIWSNPCHVEYADER
jgi:hypothetical protein